MVDRVRRWHAMLVCDRVMLGSDSACLATGLQIAKVMKMSDAELEAVQRSLPAIKHTHPPLRRWLISQHTLGDATQRYAYRGSSAGTDANYVATHVSCTSACAYWHSHSVLTVKHDAARTWY
eukprot:3892802-Rhodomonas_salina.1